MVELLRRREMVQAASSPSPSGWDVEWDYSDGLPNANGLFTLSKSASRVTISQRSGDITLDVYTTGTYIRYASTSTPQAPSVFEAKIKTDGSNGTTAQYCVISLTNGTGGVAVRFQWTASVKGIYLVNDSDVTKMTKLTDVEMGTEYTVRLVLYSNTADVYIDDVLVCSAVDISTIVGATTTGLYFEARGSSHQYLRLYSMKLKLGHT